MKHYRHLLLGCIAICLCQFASAREIAGTMTDFSEWAESADVIALVQVMEVDYRKVRNFPVEGSAELRILVPYKLPESLDEAEKLDVRASGLDDQNCYYPERENEGHRFLVFLKIDESGEAWGMQPSCMLPVFVSDNNAYALLYPVADYLLADESIVENIHYADATARVDVTELTSDEVHFLEEHYKARKDWKYYYFTRGIPLEKVRTELLSSSLNEYP